MPHVRLINPRGDADFFALVDTFAPFCDRPEDLQARLRESYPLAVVRARGLSDEAIDAWYVYRDGAWTLPDGG